MLLVIDIGNTNTVLGLYQDDRLIQTWRLQSNRKATSDELGLIYSQLLKSKNIDKKEIEACLISSVVPPLDRPFYEMVRDYLHIEAHFVGKDIDVDMPIRVVDKTSVGADRIVNAIAAWEEHRSALIIVDFGTATTFDAISAAGEYLGGAICPGVYISSEALFLHASKLPRVDFGRPNNPIGNTTEDAIKSGLLYGYIGLVKELVARISDELGAGVKVIATGGLGPFIAKETDIIDLVEPWLTLEGLNLIYKKYVSK